MDGRSKDLKKNPTFGESEFDLKPPILANCDTLVAYLLTSY
jgi:hypothetical protein